MRKEGERACDGVLTFWIVRGRPTSGVDRRSEWTATCDHDRHVSLKTSLQKYVLRLCEVGFLPCGDPLVGRSK